MNGISHPRTCYGEVFKLTHYHPFQWFDFPRFVCYAFSLSGLVCVQNDNRLSCLAAA